MQTEHPWSELLPGVGAKVLGSSLTFHEAAAIWEVGKEMEDDPLR